MKADDVHLRVGHCNEGRDYDSSEASLHATVGRVAPRLRWRSRYVAVLVASDTCALVAAGLVGVLARYGLANPRVGSSVLQLPYLLLSVILTPCWVLVLALSGVYGTRAVGVGTDEYRRLVEGSVRFVAGLAVVAYIVHLDLSRLFVAIVAPMGLLGVLGGHWVLRSWLTRQRARGHLVQRVMVVGAAVHVISLVRHLRRVPFAGMVVVAACTGGGEFTLEVDGVAIPVASDPSRLVEEAVLLSVQSLVIADTSVSGLPSLRTIAWALEGTGVDLVVAPGVIDFAGPRIAIRQVAGLPLLHVEEPRLAGPTRVVKQLGERATAATALAVLAPLLGALALLIRLTSPGPALFRQVRVGRSGVPFTMLKFRTMVTGAEAMRTGLENQNEFEGPLFKIRRDPRVTGLGRLLRRLSLDELPQLWHVLTGKMSFVGPRPPLPSEVESYDVDARRRLLVQPGLTGLWQVSGRSDLSWQESVRLDLYYVENWSLSLDLVILAKTAIAVLRGRGAY